jgi:hypothetical protein
MRMPDSAQTNLLLDHARYQADPLADATVSDILGAWNVVPPEAGIEESLRINANQWQRLGCVNRLFGKWQNNASLTDWKTQDSSASPEVAAKLEAYVQKAQAMPDWADRAKIERAEAIFLDYGILSCTLLFCSSLPECYVVPDLSAVLHVSGQLEKRTDHRIRATAAMIFPVMMPGGLTRPGGSGIAQILKVRLIHATIRNLILRGDPEDIVQAFDNSPPSPTSGMLRPLPHIRTTGDMQQNLFSLGWNLGTNALPCNQEELAYTLLTFGYVFLRSLRKLGLGLSPADEDAYLHTWNVVGHILGIRRELMVDTMAEAADLFAVLQARGRSRQVEPDARPELAQSLMHTMEKVLPLRVLKPFPVLLTHHLCGRATASELGLKRRVSWLSRGLFAIGMLAVRAIDSVIRLVLPGYCISRLITRVLGGRFMEKILMDQIRPLKLPGTLLEQVQTMNDRWRSKSKGKR